MKKFLTAIIITALTMVISGCKSFEKIYKDTISVEDAIAEKNKHDSSTNPAYKLIIMNDLQKKLVEMKGVYVKDIIPSTNIDYDFCIIIEFSSDSQFAQCMVYSDDIDTIAKIIKGKTKINVLGDFGRIFTLLDNSIIKLEILRSEIKILE